MYCENCGTELREEAKYCPNCGSKVEKPPKPSEIDTEQQDGSLEHTIKITDTTDLHDTQTTKTKKDRSWMIFLPLIAVLALVAGINYGFDRGWISSTAEKSAAAQTQAQHTEQEHNTSEQDSKMAEQATEQHSEEEKTYDEPMTEDFSRVTDYQTYETFYGNNALFHFSYPSNFFAHSIVSADKNEVTLYMDETATAARFSCMERTDSNSVQQEYEAMYHDLMQAIYEGKKILAKPNAGDGARFIITGYTDASCTDSVYRLVYITEQYVMDMSITCSPYSSFEEEAQRSYMVDCMYRMCGFSGSSRQPRSYQEFLKDDSWKS